MKLEVAKEWIRGLRSGNYKQTRHELCKRDRFCALGVLCDIASKHIPLSILKHTDGVVEYEGCHNILPEKVRNWAGVKTHGGEFGGPYQAVWKMNDSGYTFDNIANEIEKRMEEL